MNNKLDENKKKAIDSMPYTLLVKKSIESSNREYDEFYVHQIALYINNLMKLSKAYPADRIDK